MVIFTRSAQVQIRALSGSLYTKFFLTRKECSSSFAARSTCQIFSRGGPDEENTYRYIQSQIQTREMTLPICTTTRSFSARVRNRRRRRGGGDLELSSSQSPTNESSSVGGEDRDSSHEHHQGTNAIHKPDVIIKDDAIFQKVSEEFITRAVQALEPMKAHNDVFKITRSMSDEGEKLTIGLKPGEGQYILQVDLNTKILSLTSPMSGNHVYVLCGYTGKFIGMEDGHNCEGMIVRDMIRHCHGLPHF